MLQEWLAAAIPGAGQARALPREAGGSLRMETLSLLSHRGAVIAVTVDEASGSLLLLRRCHVVPLVVPLDEGIGQPHLQHAWCSQKHVGRDVGAPYPGLAGMSSGEDGDGAGPGCGEVQGSREQAAGTWMDRGA